MSILGRVLNAATKLDKGIRTVIREHENGMSITTLKHEIGYGYKTQTHKELLFRKEVAVIYYLVWIEDGKIKEILSYETPEDRDKYVEYFKVHHQNRTYVKHDEIK